MTPSVIIDSRFPLARLKIHPVEQKDVERWFEKLADGTVDYKWDVDQLWGFIRDVQNAVGMLREGLEVTTEREADATHVAHQHCQITAAMLSASDDPLGVSVPDSVLTTASQSPFEFNWLMARHSRIVMGPGAGVPSHEIIIDRDDRNIAMVRLTAVGDHSIRMIPTNVCRPYGMDGLKLQFGYWQPKDDRFEFWPTSISEGGWVYLEQVLPVVEI